MAPGPTARPVPMAASRTVAVLKQALVFSPGSSAQRSRLRRRSPHRDGSRGGSLIVRISVFVLPLQGGCF